MLYSLRDFSFQLITFREKTVNLFERFVSACLLICEACGKLDWALCVRKTYHECNTALTR